MTLPKMKSYSIYCSLRPTKRIAKGIGELPACLETGAVGVAPTTAAGIGLVPTSPTTLVPRYPFNRAASPVDGARHGPCCP